VSIEVKPFCLSKENEQRFLSTKQLSLTSYYASCLNRLIDLLSSKAKSVLVSTEAETAVTSESKVSDSSSLRIIDLSVYS